jgi:hypothetical protein
MVDGNEFECVELHIATRAHLAEHGHVSNGAFNVTMVRRDGETFATACDAAAAVRNLIDVLGPDALYLMVGEAEDEGALRAVLVPPTVH